MAIVEVKVPQLSESVSEATMLQWKKKPGEAVAQDEILIEIETDKVVLEVPAPSAGVLAQVIKHDGDIVTADELIAKIDTEAKAGEAPAAVAAAGDAEVKPAPVAETAAATSAPAAAQASAGGAASPAATKILAEKGVSADQVSGSGRDGRITKGDALAAQAGAPAAAPAKPAAAPAPAAARREAVAAASQRTGIGRSVAEGPPGTARADVASACAYRRASARIAANQRHPDDVQRSQHGAGHGSAQQVQGPLREGTRREARLHVVLREPPSTR